MRPLVRYRRGREVRLTGAYAYGVMLDPDIDVDVVVPAGRERSAAVALLQALIDQSYWNGYLFYDHREKRSPRPQHAEVPRVYYVGVKAHWWDVDIWVGDAAALPPQDDWVRRGEAWTNALQGDCSRAETGPDRWAHSHLRTQHLHRGAQSISHDCRDTVRCLAESATTCLVPGPPSQTSREGGPDARPGSSYHYHPSA